MTSMTIKSGGILSFTIALTVLSMSAGGAGLPAARWEFENNLQDSVAGFNGTRVNTPVYVDGVHGRRALCFNEDADDTVFVPYTAALNTASFTVSAYVKPDNIGNAFQAVLSSCVRSVPSRGYILYATNGQHWSFWTANGTNWNKLDGPPLMYDQWVMVTGTYDAASKVQSLYIDGVLFDSTTVAVFRSNTVNPFAIGASVNSASSASYPFKGCMDEVRYYNYALSESDVDLLYHEITGRPICLSPSEGDINGDCTVDINDLGRLAWYWLYDGTCSSGGEGLEVDGLVSNWQFNNSLQDSEGGYHGARVNPAVYVEGDGGGGALYFGNLHNDTVFVPHQSALNTASFTVSAYVKPETIGAAYQAVLSSCVRSVPSSGYILYATNEQFWSFWTANGTNWNKLDGPPVAYGQWVMVTGTYDAASQIQSLYMDGVLYDYAVVEPLVQNTANPFAIGAAVNSASSASYWFKGSIEDVRYYDVALSGNEVALLYHETSGRSACLYSINEDLSGDCRVDYLDFARFAQDWLNEQSPPNGYIRHWQSLYSGIDYTTGYVNSPVLQKIYAFRIDLHNPNITFFTTPSNGSQPLETNSQTTANFLEQYELTVAINANLFSPCCSAVPEPKNLSGLAISNGDIVSPSMFVPNETLMLMSAENVVTILPAIHPDTAGGISGAYNAVAGNPLLLEAGVNTVVYDPNAARHPRTAAGVSSDGRYLLLMAIDGRQPGYSEGATHYETAQWLLRLGAADALNLDGGGSTTIVRAGDNGQAVVLNRPSDGALRPVGNNMGIRVD